MAPELLPCYQFHHIIQLLIAFNKRDYLVFVQKCSHSNDGRTNGQASTIRNNIICPSPPFLKPSSRMINTRNNKREEFEKNFLF